jgi:hypothetical protein
MFLLSKNISKFQRAATQSSIEAHPCEAGPIAQLFGGQFESKQFEIDK